MSRPPGSPGPAITPASHRPSSGRPHRSCRSNQSLPDCLTILVVIRPTPVHYLITSFFVFLPRLCFPAFAYLDRSPCSGFLVPVSSSLAGFYPSACSTYLPAHPATDSGPYTTASISPSYLEPLQKTRKGRTTTFARSVTLTISLLPQSSMSSWIPLSTPHLHYH